MPPFDPYSLLKNSIARNLFNWAIGTMQPFTPLFFGRSGMIFLAFFASTDLQAHFLAVWMKNSSRLVQN